MRAPRIFHGGPLTENATVELDGSAGAHVARALRLSTGDVLVLFDGSGGEYPAHITETGRRQVVVATGKHRALELESPLAIHLGIAISRGERMDWVVQKATELGVHAISPLYSERTEVKLQGERAQRRLQHWRQVAISACEQCGRNRLPLLAPPQPLDDWLRNTEADARVVLHHRADNRIAACAQPASVALLVGPEGGLSDAEIAAAESAGYRSLSLGPRVLRTETAPVAAIAILQARWGDMAPGED